MMVSSWRISPPLHLECWYRCVVSVVQTPQQHLYLGPAPLTAKPSNRICMKMKPLICAGSERVYWGVKPSRYNTLGSVKANFHQNRHGSITAVKRLPKTIETIRVNVGKPLDTVAARHSTVAKWHLVYDTCLFYFWKFPVRSRVSEHYSQAVCICSWIFMSSHHPYAIHQQ